MKLHRLPLHKFMEGGGDSTQGGERLARGNGGGRRWGECPSWPPPPLVHSQVGHISRSPRFARKTLRGGRTVSLSLVPTAGQSVVSRASEQPRPWGGGGC